MATPRAGDTFSLPLTATEFLSGRVLLDVKAQCIQPRHLKPSSPLGFYNGTLLIEIYDTPTSAPAVEESKPLVPALFVDGRAFSAGQWKILGNRAVQPEKIDFPLNLDLVGPKPHLVWGEISAPIVMSQDEYDRIDAPSTITGSGFVAPSCLHRLGRTQDIDRKRYPKLEVLDLARTNLRLSSQGAELLSRAGLEPGDYYPQALSRGLDARRFYQ